VAHGTGKYPAGTVSPAEPNDVAEGGGPNVDSPNLQDAQYPQCTYLESNIEQSPAAPTMMDTPRPSETPRRPTEKLPRDDSRDFPPPAVPAGSDKDALYWKLLTCN